MEIRLRADKKSLSIAFSAMDIYELSAELLRVESPSAEVRGHGMDDKKIIGGKRNVTIKGLESVGNYALKIIFDDGHHTGLYTWDFLKKMGENQETYFAEYLKNLESTGKSRDA